MQQSSLFCTPEDDFRAKLAAKLTDLADAGLYLGGSSWKYEGWIGSIYSADRYRVKGRFSKAAFDKECLLEYSKTFRIVCGDFAFYQFPTRVFWQRLFEQVPAPFQFAFKAPQEITLPHLARGSAPNPGFLNADFFRTQFLDLLRPYRSRVAVIVLEFGAAAPINLPEKLDRFFSQLPRDFRFAVEIRALQCLGEPYFRVLRKHGVAHVFNAWTGMPEMREQMSLDGSFTAPFTVARALLRKGRAYEDSVSLFSPYHEVREPNREVRAALHDLLVRAKRRSEPAFIFVNNRLEGFAPGTIAAVIADWTA